VLPTADGVWDVLSADEAAALVEGASCAEAACAELVAEAARRWREASRSGAVDDITAVVVKLQWHADPWAP
jgi:serine/threonine protein phosphatase PrpC